MECSKLTFELHNKLNHFFYLAKVKVKRHQNILPFIFHSFDYLVVMHLQTTLQSHSNTLGQLVVAPQCL